LIYDKTQIIQVTKYARNKGTFSCFHYLLRSCFSIGEKTVTHQNKCLPLKSYKTDWAEYHTENRWSSFSLIVLDFKLKSTKNVQKSQTAFILLFLLLLQMECNLLHFLETLLYFLFSRQSFPMLCLVNFLPCKLDWGFTGKPTANILRTYRLEIDEIFTERFRNIMYTLFCCSSAFSLVFCGFPTNVQHAFWWRCNKYEIIL